MIAVRRRSSVEHIFSLSKATFTRQLRWRCTRSKNQHTQGCNDCRGEKKTNV